MNKVYVLGGAQTDFERNWTKEGKGVIALIKEIVSDGLSAVNLPFEDITKLNRENRIGCFVGNFLSECYVNQSHLGALLTEVDPAFYGVPSARYEAACASGSVALDAAISKIQNGDFDVAIVVGWELQKTVDSKIGADFLGQAAYYEKEAKNIDFPFPKLFARLADEILEKYNLDEKRFMDSLAMISNKNYANAKRNPLAQTRKWFMDFEQASHRNTPTNTSVGGKLAVSDCSQVTDGAAIVVLVSDEYKKRLDIDCPVVLGYGHRVAPMLFDKKAHEAKQSQHMLPWTRQAVLDAYRRSGLSVDDIDFFETHDCFTSSEYAAVSAFGLTEPGDEYKAIEEGITSFSGNKPINASGGLIGCGHPVGASGVRMFLDLYKQISGKSGRCQLNKADIGMMLNIGGSATTNYTFILGNNDKI
ncbi:MAG: acetyl-CoA acetyltransferase [Defluviitaleaceae bacterium]|nr:acetyl-CoA acetyltransferase [Defluviitaleaceae bacterium]